MSPNDIEVLIHYYGSRSGHPRIDAPAVRDAIDRFLKARLMVRVASSGPTDTYEVTEGGRMLVDQLCAVPFPVLRWVAGDEFSGCCISSPHLGPCATLPTQKAVNTSALIAQWPSMDNVLVLRDGRLFWATASEFTYSGKLEEFSKIEL